MDCRLARTKSSKIVIETLTFSLQCNISTFRLKFITFIKKNIYLVGQNIFAFQVHLLNFKWNWYIKWTSMSGILWRMHDRGDSKFPTVMYSDHLQSWLHFGHGLFVFLILSCWLPASVYQASSWWVKGAAAIRSLGLLVISYLLLFFVRLLSIILH